MLVRQLTDNDKNISVKIITLFSNTKLTGITCIAYIKITPGIMQIHDEQY